MNVNRPPFTVVKNRKRRPALLPESGADDDADPSLGEKRCGRVAPPLGARATQTGFGPMGGGPTRAATQFLVDGRPASGPGRGLAQEQPCGLFPRGRRVSPDEYYSRAARSIPPRIGKLSRTAGAQDLHLYPLQIAPIAPAGMDTERNDSMLVVARE
jgi:hypothetical protein